MHYRQPLPGRMETCCVSMFFKNKIVSCLKKMDNQHYHQQENTDLFTDEPLVYAGFGDRFLALIIDSLILAIPNVLLSYAANDPENPLVNLVGLVIGWLYFTLQESGAPQATLGKKAMGIRVIGQDGQRISFGQATGRYFGKIISAIILLIGYFMVLWDPNRQALHDKMAGTYVVKN
jgi:uncharacterized RDD family membrane protein YckC